MQLMIATIFLFFSYSLASAESEPIPAPVSLQIQKLVILEKHYQELVQQGGWPVWNSAEMIHPGEEDDRIEDLRIILKMTGDYTEAEAPLPPSLYDTLLQLAVRKFQLRHGFNPDGVIGKSTQEALALPASSYLLHIQATLKRLKKIKGEFEDKFILVNLPAYQLYVITGGIAVLSMRVIVGNKDNHTPVFDSTLTDITFNPFWHVPKRIARNELLPKLQEDPDYFVKGGFVITDEDGNELDPQTASMEQELTFRQTSGDKNALGKIKFNLSRSNDIYLHSTPNPKLFDKDYRALSHGCVRVEKPRELAYFILEQTANWSKEKIDAAYDESRQRYVKVEPVPVHVVYMTAYVDEKGVANFYADIYQKDK